jgi:rare lipoprotein A
MRRTLLALACLAFPLSSFAADASALTRRDGFLLIWQSLGRPAPGSVKQTYDDVKKGDKGFAEISYANSRNILGDYDAFRPDDSLTLGDGLTWLLRTRNVDDPEKILPDTLSGYLLQYPIAKTPTEEQAAAPISQETLLYLERSLDTMLRDEVHEASLYAEKWNGQGTAFGETFDMNALTAAHRTFPYNTLVKVTNQRNDKSVIVRITDRGPYVKGRDMDLSLAAFLAIEDRSKGIVNATFQRLGDVSVVNGCNPEFRKYQTRVSRTTVLQPGIPWTLPLGESLNLRSNVGFAVRGVRYPDGSLTPLQDWITKDQVFVFKPSVEGDYGFLMRSLDGKMREMTMKVVLCAAGA